jgi:hypothetical protein
MPPIGGACWTSSSVGRETTSNPFEVMVSVLGPSSWAAASSGSSSSVMSRQVE